MKKIKAIRKKYIYIKSLYHLLSLSIILLITIFLLRNIFFNSTLPVGDDYLGYIAGAKYISRNWFILWIDRSFGSCGSFASNIYIFPALLSYLLGDSVIGVKTFTLLTILFSGISMYFLVYYYLKNISASLISSLFYILNLYLIQRLVLGHLNFAFGYSIAPLMLIYLDKSLNQGKIKDMIIFSLFVFLIIFSRYDIFFYYFVMLFCYTVIFILFSGNIYKSIVNSIKLIVISCLVDLSLFAYSVVPTIFKASPPFSFLASKLIIERLKIYAPTLLKTIVGVPSTLGYLGENPSTYYIGISFVCLIFLSLILIRDRFTISFTIMALISIFFAKGTFPPLGNLYKMLWMSGLTFFSAPDRWMSIQMLSYSVLIGFTINYFSNNIIKTSRLIKIILIILIIFVLIIGRWNILSTGLPTWAPPKDDIKAYRWVSNKYGDFMIATVPYYQKYMKFGGSYLDHDLGFESYLFHGKKVVRIGEGNPYSYDFVSYTHGIILSNNSRYLMKILGAFNVKYLIINDYFPTSIRSLPRNYPPNHQHIFFKNQKGIKLVYISGNVTVYENEYWVPHVFASSKSAIVIGGRETLTTLAEIDKFNFSAWNILFADQIIRTNGKKTFLDMLNNSSMIVFQDASIYDLAMLLINDSESIRIVPVKYAYPSRNAEKYWIASDYAIKRGLFVYNSRTLHTKGENSVEISFSVGKDDYYEIWMRGLYGKNKGELTVKVSNITRKITPYSEFETFKWVKVADVYLKNGEHKIIIQNKRSKYGISNDIDEIMVIKKNIMEKYRKKAEQLIKEFNGNIIMSFDKEQLILKDVAEEKPIINENLLPYWRGTDENSIEYKLSREVPLDYRYSLELNLKGKRKYYTMIDFTFEEMQDWKNYTGFYIWFKGQGTGKTFFIDIYFNKSYNNWVRYTFVDDSKEWKRIVVFKSEFKSKKGVVDWSKVWKVRIGSDDKNLIGRYYIGTLNAFIGEKRILGVNVPRTDNYRIGMQVEGREKINITIDNIININITPDREWVDIGDFIFEKGNHKIAFKLGKDVKIRRIILYSVKNSETLEEILSTKDKNVTITYRKINPTKYIAHVKTDKPIFLLFSDSYHPLWKAYVNGKEYSSIIAYSFINSFYIPETGEYDVAIEFTGQKYVWIGMAISSVTFIFIILYLISGDRAIKPLNKLGERVWRKMRSKLT